MPIDQASTIPAIVGLNLPFDINIPNVKTNITKELDIRNKKKKKVESIILSELKIIIINPSNATFDFLNSVEIILIAEGLPEVIIASNYDISDDVGSSILLNVNSMELKDYILKDTVKLKVKVEVDQLVTQDYAIFIHSDFFVDARVLGI